MSYPSPGPFTPLTGTAVAGGHPSGKPASFLIVSAMMPGETAPDWGTTAICSPHGQYHLM